jgi:hypothetical protein
MALLTDISWSTLCLSYWILSFWVFDKTCGSYFMVPRPVSVMLPELPLHYVHWAIYRKAGTSFLTSLFTRPESSWFWCTRQRWILQRTCCSVLKVAVPQCATLLEFFSASVSPCFIGPKLVWCAKPTFWASSVTVISLLPSATGM